ncbi:hypothetical protein IQ06DRAFT_341993 [Phaeosphaeriaceae sp. SRC1lsM3a]|nr:hypothetical protein IQ06DRAFT_341993 [Stagonospora sp. SRC1lsM3a]
MNRFNQPWYQGFESEFDLDDETGEASGRLSPLVDRSPNSSLPSAKVPIDHSMAMFLTSQSHVLSLASTGDMWAASSSQATTQEDATELHAILTDESSQAAANTPNSFYYRVLQTTLPHMQPRMKTMSEEISYTEDPSEDHRADSGIGEFDDIPPFNNFAHSPPFVFDHPDENHWHPENDFFPAHNTKKHEEESQYTGPLQYHLMQTESRTTVRNVHPDETKKAEVCHLCHRQYTGTWAHRNLTRHMESVHAPCSSSTGQKQIRCGFDGCDRTFRREDARLVHERRSHPELNRPPPAKRRRSADNGL